MYKRYILKEFESYIEQNPEMTFGQMVLSTLAKKGDGTISKSDWLFSTSDEDFYTALQNAMDDERE